MKLGDKLLFIIICVTTIAYLGLSRLNEPDIDTLYVQISQNGTILHKLQLKDIEETKLTFEWDGKYNIVKITNEYVEIIEANCPNQQCVIQGRINRPGQSIICLPHRLVVELKANEGSEIDYIVK